MSSSAVIFLVCDIVKCTFFFSLKKKKTQQQKTQPNIKQYRKIFPSCQEQVCKTQS